MIVAGLAGIGASFGFKGALFHQDEITTIRAADGPAKIHREMAAGTVIPDQDASILGGSPQQPPVAVVNNVEQPADLTAPANLPEAQATPPRAIVGLATGAASVPVPAPPAQAQPQPSAETLNIADLIEPKKVPSVLVRPGCYASAKRRAATGYGGRRSRSRSAPHSDVHRQGPNAKIGGARGDETQGRPRSMRMAIRGREPPLPPRPSGWSLPTRGKQAPATAALQASPGSF